MIISNIHKEFKCLFYLFYFFLLVSINVLGQNFRNQHKDLFENPPKDYWPHTRWWWPGNATSKENITYELEQMKAHGIRGVEQITMPDLLENVHADFLSGTYFTLVKHAVKEAKRLEMEISFNFGGPGWIIGGDWVTDKDRSRDMVPTFIEVEGSQKIITPLPDNLIKTNRSWEIYHPKLSGDEKLIAVVAGKIIDGIIDPNSLSVITDKVINNKINWKVPEGKWKIMCFWLAVDKSNPTVNHFDTEAVQRYCDYLGGKFEDAVGEDFGSTIDSFFFDSFELPYLASGIKWSDDLLPKFQEDYKYDLTKYLPAIWWEVANTSPKIRYDVNEFLSKTGFQTFFATILNWTKLHDIKARIQPYGFETDILQGSGMADIPEMEITPGEKDQHPWYDTRIGPKKYVASGAHIYGKEVISVEAYTFIHKERFRTTLQDLKIASDGFLRSGATKFYNHSYSASEERDLAPSRRMPWAPQIIPTNTWWEYYPLLAAYIARNSYVLRQGEFVADIAIYSPLANQWTKNALNARRWTRDFDWGDLGNLLLSNGYDFDLLNDDALQNLATFENGNLNIGSLKYKVLLLPNIESLPLKTLQKIEAFVSNGGTVIALDRVPNTSTGFINSIKNDQELNKTVSKLFGNLSGKSIASNKIAKGNVHYLKKVIHREIWWDQYSAMLDPFLKLLENYVPPDFEIDYAQEMLRKNNGLSFLHRKTETADVYFISNVQDIAIDMPINFKVFDKHIWNWNPYNGDINKIFQYEQSEKGIQLPIKLAPLESTIIVFENGTSNTHVTNTNVDKIITLTKNEVLFEASNNGIYEIVICDNYSDKKIKQEINDIPAPFQVHGSWHLILENDHFKKIEKDLNFLTSWTKDTDTKHFSGTGVYTTQFNLSKAYFSENLKLILDLGKIGNIADVRINGKKAGVIWMKGQTCEITNFVKPGNNSLKISVTNTNINRVSAFKKLQAMDDKLIKKYGPTKSDMALPKEFGFEPLPPSGLMGPILIKPLKIVRIKLN